MKGNVMVDRNSLLDFAQYNSWIKKSNYEGIFNAVIVIFLFLLIHKPLVRKKYLAIILILLDKLGEDGETFRARPYK